MTAHTPPEKYHPVRPANNPEPPKYEGQYRQDRGHIHREPPPFRPCDRPPMYEPSLSQSLVSLGIAVVLAGLIVLGIAIFCERAEPAIFAPTPATAPAATPRHNGELAWIFSLSCGSAAAVALHLNLRRQERRIARISLRRYLAWSTGADREIL